MHNLYPLLYNEAVSGGDPAGDGATASCGDGRRSVGASARRCAGRAIRRPTSTAWPARCVAGSPWDSPGVPFWSNDIGGYRGMPSPDLYVRWAQFGLFCSHSRMHGDSPREPWIFGEEALRIVRQYVHLRYRLFPYLYSAAIEASRTAMPVMRALPLLWPDDPHAHVLRSAVYARSVAHGRPRRASFRKEDRVSAGRQVDRLLDRRSDPRAQRFSGWTYRCQPFRCMYGPGQ